MSERDKILLFENQPIRLPRDIRIALKQREARLKRLSELAF